MTAEQFELPPIVDGRQEFLSPTGRIESIRWGPRIAAIKRRFWPCSAPFRSRFWRVRSAISQKSATQACSFTSLGCAVMISGRRHVRSRRRTKQSTPIVEQAGNGSQPGHIAVGLYSSQRYNPPYPITYMRPSLLARAPHVASTGAPSVVRLFATADRGFRAYRLGAPLVRTAHPANGMRAHAVCEQLWTIVELAHHPLCSRRFCDVCCSGTHSSNEVDTDRVDEVRHCSRGDLPRAKCSATGRISYF